MKMDKRNKPMSIEQKNLLIEYMSSHPQLKQKFSNDYTRQDYMKMWIEVANLLNATPGANKEWKDWRKSWQDIQSRTKSKKGKINAHSSRTGGGPALPDLSSEEMKIVEIIGDTAIRGIDVVEPQVDDIEVDEITFSQSGNLQNTDSCMNDVTLANSTVEENSYIENKSSVLKSKNAAPSGRKKKNVATQRLDKAVEQSNETLELLREKVHIKIEYYAKKLEIMTRNVIANENIATELRELKLAILAHLKK